MLYKGLIRPLLFSLSPERAHNFASACIQRGAPFFSLLGSSLQYRSPRLENRVAGLPFVGPTGMAAGFDKKGLLYPQLLQLGFDFVECGSFTPHPQKGNPLPRLFRLSENGALINHMGFNNPGAEKAAQNFSKQKKSLVRGINIGKSKDTPIERAKEDYLYSIQKLAPFADYITINISSPNTPNLRRLEQEKEILKELLQGVQEKLRPQKTGKENKALDQFGIPLFVKLSPELSFAELDAILEILIETKAAGVILTNTSLDLKKEGLGITPHKKGGLSGRPIRKKSTQLIRHCFRQGRQKLAIIGVGGIDSGEAALEKILAGASLVQLYTGYIYEGPFLAARINHYIDTFLEKENVSISEIVGLEAQA